MREFVAQLQSWEAFDASQGAAEGAASPPEAWTEEAVLGLLAGMFPWRNLAGSSAILQLLAAQYKECLAEVRLCLPDLGGGAVCVALHKLVLMACMCLRIRKSRLACVISEIVIYACSLKQYRGCD